MHRNVAEHRKAFHDYHILETFEAGAALLGTEVKSIREGNVNLRDSAGATVASPRGDPQAGWQDRREARDPGAADREAGSI